MKRGEWGCAALGAAAVLQVQHPYGYVPKHTCKAVCMPVTCVCTGRACVCAQKHMHATGMYVHVYKTMFRHQNACAWVHKTIFVQKYTCTQNHVDAQKCTCTETCTCTEMHMHVCTKPCQCIKYTRMCTLDACSCAKTHMHVCTNPPTCIKPRLHVCTGLQACNNHLCMQTQHAYM